MVKDKDEAPKEKSNALKFIICFFLFFVIGAVLGYYCTTKYLSERDNELPEMVDNSSLKDITEDDEYANLIKDLSSIIDDAMFYSFQGLSSATIASEQKLSYLYDYIIEKKEFVDTSLNASWYGNATCEHDFLVETVTNADGSSYTTGACPLKRITANAFKEAEKKFFETSTVDVSAEFMVKGNTKCIVDEGGILCGLVSGGSEVTGELIPKFEVQKVMKDTDNTIYLLNKGYLQDTRSTIVNPDDGYEKYFLHSSDSTDYYYELKSADNLTFKHIFKERTDGSYYYVSSEVNE